MRAHRGRTTLACCALVVEADRTTPHTKSPFPSLCVPHRESDAYRDTTDEGTSRGASAGWDPTTTHSTALYDRQAREGAKVHRGDLGGDFLTSRTFAQQPATPPPPRCPLLLHIHPRNLRPRARATRARALSHSHSPRDQSSVANHIFPDGRRRPRPPPPRAPQRDAGGAGCAAGPPARRRAAIHGVR